MSRGAKKRKQIVLTCAETGDRLGVYYVHNAAQNLAAFKEKIRSTKYNPRLRKKVKVKFKEEKHSS